MASNRSSRNRVSQTEKRRARRGRRQQKSRLKAGLAMGGMGILAVLIIAGLALPSFGGGASQHTTTETLSDRPTGASAPGTFFADQGRVHLDIGERNPVGYYNSSPPTSGTHAPSWVDCGIHDEPIENEFQVHNLEHGFVMIQYNTEDESVITQLESIVQQLDQWPNYLILAPYPAMEETIALTAWGVAQYMETVDPSDIEAFATAYRGRGPEANTPSCGAGGFMEQAG